MSSLNVPATVPSDADRMRSKKDTTLKAKLSVGSPPKESAWMRLPGPEPVWHSVWTGSEGRAVVYQRGGEFWVYQPST